MRSLLGCLDALNLELDPIALFEMMDAPIESEQDGMYTTTRAPSSAAENRRLTRTTDPTASLSFYLSGADRCIRSHLIPNETG